MLSNKAAEAITTRLYKLCYGILKPTVVIALDAATLRGIGPVR